MEPVSCVFVREYLPLQRVPNGQASDLFDLLSGQGGHDLGRRLLKTRQGGDYSRDGCSRIVARRRDMREDAVALIPVEQIVSREWPFRLRRLSGLNRR